MNRRASGSAPISGELHSRFARLFQDNLPGLWADVLVSAASGLVCSSAAAGQIALDVPAEMAAGAGAMTLVSRMRWPAPRQVAVVLFITGCLCAGWVLSRGMFAALCDLFSWLVFAVRRIHDLSGRTDPDVQFPRLFIDGAPILFGMFLAWGSLVHGHLPAVWAASGLYSGAVLLRVVALRKAQIDQARALGAHDFPSLARVLGPVGMGLGMVAAGLFFPAVRAWMLPAGIAAVFVLLFIRERRVVWSWLVPLLLLLLLPLLRHYSLRGMPVPPSNLHGSRGLPAAQHTAGGGWHTGWGLTTLALFLACLALAWLAWRWLQNHQPHEETSAAVVPVIERVRMEPPRRTVPGPAPTPVRRLMQTWLQVQAQRGQPIQAGETARQYANRFAGGTGDEPDWLDELVPMYEAERYGGQPASETAVTRLQAAMVKAGALDE